MVDGSTYLFASDGARQTGTGWVDGVYLEDGIVPTGMLELDGKTYIIGENGLPLTGEFAFEGVNYFADESGIVYIDAIRTITVGEQTFLRYYDADGQVPTGWLETQGADYYQNDEFYLLTGRQDIGNNTYFFGTNGKLSTEDGWAGDYYVVDGVALEGMQEIDGENYYFKADGIVTKGAFVYENNNYYADETGAIVKNSIIYNEAQVGTYYGESGAAAGEGFYEVAGESYYQKADKTLATGKLTIDGDIYFFSAQGAMVTDSGWADNYYLQDGVALVGAYNIGDNYYIFATDGQVFKGKFTFEGNSYYADETGAVLIEDFYTDSTGTTYYGENGIAPTGWFEIGTQTYYQHANFTLATQKTTIDGEEYYFNTNGTMITAGWVGDVYVRDGQIVTGPQTINGKKYIFSNLGIAYTHNFTYNGEKYAADGKGVLHTHSFITEQGFITYYNEDGKAPLGWIELTNGDKYYQDESYHLLTGANTIDGEIYFFGTNGKLATEDGWAGDYYLQNGTALTGMQEIDDSTYYFDENGLLVKGAFEFEGAEYRTSEQGVLYILSIADNEDGTRTYYGESGILAPEGWVSLGEHRYYQTAQKTLATGKQTIGGDIYFFSAQGELVTNTGWADDYYLVDGKALTGKQVIEEKTYIFSADGQVFKGEFTFEGEMYTSDENGALYSSTIITLENGNLRYLNENGIAQTGFVTLGDKTYYQKDDFTLVTGMLELGDDVYFFAEDGAQQTGTGWVDEYYLINGAPAVGKQTIGEKLYIFDEEGKVKTGEFTFEGEFYIANAQGSLYKSAVIKKQNASLVYLNEQGFAPLGWVDANGKKYYQSENDGDISLSTGFATIDDVEYYFSANGELFSGRTSGYYLINNVAYYILNDGRVVRQPTIDTIDTLHDASKELYSVTVNYTISTASSAHADGSISFDGGKTWQTSNTFTVDASDGKTFAAGTIRVRDALGQVTSNTQTIYLAPVINVPATDANSGPGSYGIDVSMYQYNVDWNAVAASGIEFAIIRATSANNSGYYEDPYYEKNVREAKAAGLDVGLYIYSYASNYTEAQEEINFFVNTQGTKNLKASGIVLDYPVYVDYEDNLNLEGTTYTDRTNIVRYMMQLLEQNGYYPGFYTYHYYSSFFDVKGLVNEGYDFWYARYPAAPNPTVNPSSSFGAQIGIWQYCSDGNTNPDMKPYVNGVYTGLDLNYVYIDIPAKVHAFYGVSGQQTTPTAPSGTITVENMLTVYDITTQRTVTDSVLNIVSKVVQTEVGGFNNTEVYKAQAVAAHSYILNISQNGGVANVALTSASQSVINATKSVIDEIVTYNGLVANTMWSAAGSGKTLSSQEMWGGYYPYLISGIDSPGDLKATTYLNYGTSYNGKQTTITTERAISNIEKLLPGSTAGRTDYYNWLSNPEYNEYGHLTYITVMGVRMRVGKFYDNFWGMYSPHCTITYNNNGTWTFTTIGNGHGVGMSQWGAYDYALQGWTYSQILAHYYPGTQLKTV